MKILDLLQSWDCGNADDDEHQGEANKKKMRFISAKVADEQIEFMNQVWS